MFNLDNRDEGAANFVVELSLNIVEGVVDLFSIKLSNQRDQSVDSSLLYTHNFRNNI